MPADDRRLPQGQGQADDRVPAAFRRRSTSRPSTSRASGQLGALKFFNSSFSMTVRRGDIRTKRAYRRRHALRHRRVLHQCRAQSVSRGADAGLGGVHQQRPGESVPRSTRRPPRRCGSGTISVATFITSFNAADVGCVSHRRHEGRPPRRPGLRICRGARVHADDRRQDDAQDVRQARPVRAGTAVFLRLHPERSRARAIGRRRHAGRDASSRRSTQSARVRQADRDPSIHEAATARPAGSGSRGPVSESRR